MFNPCPNCNTLRAGRNCYVHNVITCINCLYDGPNSKCDAPSFIKQSEKYKAEKDKEMDELLERVRIGGDMWTTQ
jgi:hypothetical protein